MKPDDPLLRILACPLDKGPLHLLPAAGRDGGEEALYNPRLRRRYPVIDGIPQLLPSSGEQVSDEEHATLLTHVSEDRVPEDRVPEDRVPEADPSEGPTAEHDAAEHRVAGNDTRRPGAPGAAT